MQELSVVVALLVVYNIYLTLKINAMHKHTLNQSGRLTTELLKKSIPLITEKINKSLNVAVNDMEKIIVDYIDRNDPKKAPDKDIEE